MKRTTKTITKGGFMSLLSMSAVAVGLAAASLPNTASAATGTAATWVQPINFTLTARTSGGLAAGTKINNKAIIGFLTGGATVSVGTNGGGGTNTITVIVSIPSTDTLVTNPPVLGTNLFTLTGTNGIFGTNDTLQFSNFPPSITATGIVVTVGTNSTTNTVTLDETTNNPPTYTFTNFITLVTTNGTGTNAVTVTNTGHIFTGAFAGGNTNFPTGTNADYITAVLQTTNGATNGLVWSFEASYLTNIVSTTTNTSGTNTVTVTAVKGDSLVLVTVLPPTGTAPYMGSVPPVVALSHGKGNTRTLTDLSAFISFTPNTAAPVVTSGTATLTSYGLSTLSARVDTGGVGTPVNLTATTFFKETDKSNSRAGAVVPTGIPTTDIGFGALAGTANNVVFEGTVNATGGSVSSIPLTTP